MSSGFIRRITYPGPPTGEQSDLYEVVVDINGVVWVCTAAGNPGSWQEGSSGSGGGGADVPVSGLTPLTQGFRFVGMNTTTGAPGSGTFETGDIAFDTVGMLWVCTAGGTPGTWASLTSGAQAESDFENVRLDRIGEPQAALYMNNQQITAVAAATAPTSAPQIQQMGGWIPDANVWTYVSATSFTVSGNLTGTYAKGTKLKWSESGTVKYGVVASSSYSSPTTTVTMIATTSYAMAASPDSNSTYYSLGYPTDFPSTFGWSPTSFTGFSTNPSTTLSSWAVNGRNMTITFAMFTAGTSNAATFTVALPIASAMTADMICSVEDSGTEQIGCMYITAASGTLAFGKGVTSAAGGFTTSGSKNATGILTYPF